MNILENPTLYKELWLKNIDCECLLELPHQGGSNEHPQSLFEVKKGTLYQ